MSEKLYYVVVGIYVLIAASGKTFAHEGGHAFVLMCINARFIRQRVPGYTPQKITTRVGIGMGRVDSPLYRILVEQERLGLIQLSAAAGIVAEIVYCVILLAMTTLLFRNMYLSISLFGVLGFFALAMFFGAHRKSQSDCCSFLHPKTFRGEIKIGGFSESDRRMGSVKVLMLGGLSFTVFLILSVCTR